MEQGLEGFSYFSDPPEFVRSALCYGDGMGVETAPDFCIDRAYFDNFVVMYVEQGRLIHEQCGRVLTAGPGQYVFADLRLPHRYAFEKGVPSVLYWTHINGRVAAELALSIGRCAPLPFLGSSAAVRQALLDCFALCEGGDAFALSLKLYALLLSVLADSRARGGASPDGRRELEARRLEEALKQFVYRPADLQKIAAALNLSKYHLCHQCTRLLGVSPMKKLTEEKIRTACRHLRYTNEKVEVIARRLSFTSVSYFSRVFKAELGVSPAQYRRQARERSARELTPFRP